MKFLKFNLVLISFLVVFFGCKKDSFLGEDGLVSGRSSCLNSVSYDVEVIKTVSYDSNEGLTTREKVLMVPNYEFYSTYICNKGNNEYYSEVESKPENTPMPVLPDYSLGFTKHIKWKSICINGVSKLYDVDGVLIEESSAPNIPTLDLNNLEKFTETEILDSDSFNDFINELKAHLNITTLANGDYQITHPLQNGNVLVVTINKLLQRETKYTTYTPNREIQSIVSLDYKVLDPNSNNIISNTQNLLGAKVKLKSETFVNVLKSPDSDKKMLVTQKTIYKNIQTN
jgi:hypothetical protein